MVILMPALGWIRDHYTELKELAGPVASIIAAFAAVSVTAYFARHQKRIAAEQAHVAKEKLRYDLFDRRLEIFSSIFAMYHAIIGWEATPEQIAAKERFFKAYQESGFLFKEQSGIQKLLGELNEDARKVIAFKELKTDLAQDRVLFAQLFKEVENIHLNKFPAGLEKLRLAMADYLNFHSI
jgi:hypothetical protein